MIQTSSKISYISKYNFINFVNRNDLNTSKNPLMAAMLPPQANNVFYNPCVT